MHCLFSMALSAHHQNINSLLLKCLKLLKAQEMIREITNNKRNVRREGSQQIRQRSYLRIPSANIVFSSTERISWSKDMGPDEIKCLENLRDSKTCTKV